MMQNAHLWSQPSLILTYALGPLAFRLKRFSCAVGCTGAMGAHATPPNAACGLKSPDWAGLTGAIVATCCSVPCSLALSASISGTISGHVRVESTPSTPGTQLGTSAA